MKSCRSACPAVLIGLLIGLAAQPGALQAWGRTGHGIVGSIAYAGLDETARQAVDDALPNPGPDAFAAACFWPDTVRPVPGWEWTAPLHFVNLPRDAQDYQRERDCPDSRCISEHILRCAGALRGGKLAGEERRQALAWLCHLVGDLHQPLHAGIAEDRGGNRVEVEFEGETINLHHFWDRALIASRIASDDRRLPELERTGAEAPSHSWNPSEVADWTGESHRLAREKAYPDGPFIDPAGRPVDPAFADRSWEIIQDRLQLAGERLARILNAVLGEKEIEAGPARSQIPGDAEADACVSPVGLRR